MPPEQKLVVLACVVVAVADVEQVAVLLVAEVQRLVKLFEQAAESDETPLVESSVKQSHRVGGHVPIVEIDDIAGLCRVFRDFVHGLDNVAAGRSPATVQSLNAPDIHYRVIIELADLAPVLG